MKKSKLDAMYNVAKASSAACSDAFENIKLNKTVAIDANTSEMTVSREIVPNNIPQIIGNTCFTDRLLFLFSLKFLC